MHALPPPLVSTGNTFLPQEIQLSDHILTVRQEHLIHNVRRSMCHLVCWQDLDNGKPSTQFATILYKQELSH